MGATHRELGLESERRLFGSGVSYCATCDGAFFRNKTVAVVGGGDTAASDALYLSKLASKVYLIHRRDSFRASRFLVERVQARENIRCIMSTVVEEVLGEERVQGLRLRNVSNGNTGTLEVNGLFVAVGLSPTASWCADLSRWTRAASSSPGRTVKRVCPVCSLPATCVQSRSARSSVRFQTAPSRWKARSNILNRDDRPAACIRHCGAGRYTGLRCPFLDAVMPFISGLGDGGAVWIGLTLVLMLFRKTRKTGYMMALALVLGLLIGNLTLKPLIARIRPYDANPDVTLLIDRLSDYSFPSGHTLASFEAAAVLLLQYRAKAIPAL